VSVSEQDISTDRSSLFQGVKRVVVKLGTRVVTVHDYTLNLRIIERLACEVSQLTKAGIQVAVVSSGAVGAGMGRLGLKERPRKIPELQATAAVGQGLLMNAYKLAFREFQLPIGQVLITAEDLDDRQRYVNARNTLEALLRLGAVPVVNENDSVAVEEMKVGDNDRISALVAHLVDAELLVILTDVEGLYSGDPALRGDAELIREVSSVTKDLLDRAGSAGSAVSLGGMRAKLQAAESATSGGRMTVIANGHNTGLSEILEGKEVGTLFLADKRHLNDRKLWIVNSRKKGAVVIDQGAADAVGERGKSLLPSGILAVRGKFEAGEMIGVEGDDGTEVARGLVRYGSGDVRKILGRKTSEIPEILTGMPGEEVIHRDDMVVL